MRGYNSGTDGVEVKLKPSCKYDRAFRATLAEAEVELLRPDLDGAVVLNVRGCEVVTLRFLYTKARERAKRNGAGE